ncbi:MAG: GNAT family N-acetyltransferase [Pseudomonadales bacterium]|nr:GNAT family N-acetyltransferase [Pseudomonadales bacterium]MBO6563908.1 GNAT family N-acetyltransferase [Pseudomonadales bacterium]MBO6594802.1 GNAT family N-acetyltransferase [Pseudomonadales bacterium]MBO6658355.1 GNAT family N-acetyltransferase [Pseudomonadales bacterium]MBO6701307.1 GNAT family N-acetyltransferase [Pseudomonadales bacterium]
MTEDISISDTALKGKLRHDVALLLSEAFGDDESMIAMLGERRWRANAYRYFELQLDHSDHVVLEEEDGELTGVLLARSPHAATSPRAVWQLLKMIWLLGLEFPHSQRIAQTISQALPAPPYWYINQIAVKPNQQKRGLGSRLLNRLLLFVGNDCVYVDCATELNHFYEAQGFEQIEVFPAFDLQLMASHP